MTSSPSVQLYTVRDAVSADLQGAVARIAEIGFTKVEPYSFVERADEFEKAFADSGVTAPSGHAPVIDSDEPERAFAAAVQLGIGTVIDCFQVMRLPSTSPVTSMLPIAPDTAPVKVLPALFTVSVIF